jgi:hypothetical protein
VFSLSEVLTGEFSEYLFSQSEVPAGEFSQYMECFTVFYNIINGHHDVFSLDVSMHYKQQIANNKQRNRRSSHFALHEQ